MSVEEAVRRWARDYAPHVAAADVEAVVAVVRADPERFDAVISELARMEVDATPEPPT